MENSLLQQYRRDRRKLLDFILSTSPIKEVRTPAGVLALSDVDLDTISADYVLECIQSGGVLDVSEASEKYHGELRYPVIIDSPLGSFYFLFSDPDMSGSPPRRAPPQVGVKQIADCSSLSSSPQDCLDFGEVDISVEEDRVRYPIGMVSSSKPVDSADIPSLGLPMLRTGLSDDDLQESAYEVLLASMIISGVEVHLTEDKEKEKKSRLLSGLKNRRAKAYPQCQSTKSHLELLDMIRTQMQISEAMDALIRKRMAEFASRATCGQLDIPQISLALLSSFSKSDFPSEKSYMKWKKRQANILEELLYYCANHITAEHMAIRSLLAKIRNSVEWDVRMSPHEHAEFLLAIRRFASKMLSMPGEFHIQDGTYYWTHGYALNVKLYEKLLASVFDILEEGQLVEEAYEILMLIKLTWPILGISQKMHNALYGWILLQQFIETDEPNLLENAFVEVQKVLSYDGNDGKEGAYMNSLICSKRNKDSEANISVVHAVFFSMRGWFDSKLQDYHLFFSQKPFNFERMVAFSVAVRVLTDGEYGYVELTKPSPLAETGSRHLQTCIKMSIEAAYTRVVERLDLKSKVERRHPLAFLADQIRLIAEKEASDFSPVLCHWCPEAGIISSVLLHELYGERLKPFLARVTCLSEDVRSVLPAADMLERELTRCYFSACEENGLPPFRYYQIGDVSGPIILNWVNAQHAHILEWTERACNLEDWEPLSFQQKQAASIIEVFRMIEETVDQFFGLTLPMDIIHLQSLLSLVFQSLDAYLLKMVNRLVEKNRLFPSAPALTRYTETTIPIIKKKSIEQALREEEVVNELNELTVSKLCIRLNTLQYIDKQIELLEDGIKKSWALVRPCPNCRWIGRQLPEALKKDLPVFSESVDELFTSFKGIRMKTTNAINKICDFIGAKVVFWDLRDLFLFHLYRGNVGSARLENILPHVDTILDHICGMVNDTIRDTVVLSICRASLEGYQWVLLDGGPSRVFSDSDISMMQEDLNTLKDFFVADGEGLPRAVVEQEATLAQQILSLFSLQTEVVIDMLMSASEQISVEVDCQEHGSRCIEGAHTLIRVLCHKKDREASKFLKMQYQLPKSSEYDDSPLKGSASKSPVISDMLKRSTSFQWTKKSQRSFKSIKKKLQNATSEIRRAAR